jgi:tRNA A-37 threonylcarbamoyl transferase component Bud32
VITIGELIQGKYRLVRLLGDGGMGSVYEAQHEALGTRVAIKVLHPELARRTGLVERFLQEARVAAQIRSPHVVQVTDVDRTVPDGHAYIVMELLEGEPLSSVLDRQRKLPVTTSCEYTIQVLEALEAAHALGVIHRDLKPENVFLTFVAGKPVLKLIDFGIAKLRRAEGQKALTVAGVIMGTAEYMAPEQARSADKVDARADIYAVGVMLYEMLSGVRPVSGDDARVIALKVERGEVTPLVQAAPEVPRELAGLVHRAMAARPELRFASATEMRLALADAMTGKRPPTGVMAAAGGARNDGGTGAMPMHAPMNAQPTTRATGTHVADARAGSNVATSVLAQHAMHHEDPRVDTQRTPAVQLPHAHAYPAQGAHVAPGPMHVGSRGRKKSRSGIVWLVTIPLLLGAGIVAAFVWSASNEPDPVAPRPTTPATTTAPPSAKPSAHASATPSGDPLTPFNPGAPSHTSGGGAAPTAHPSGGPAPPHVPDAGGGGVPPFPSGFPIPSGFPTALPSGFPSAFPFPMPPAPQPTSQPTTQPTTMLPAPTTGPGY